jgi:hypothetical protein
MPLAPGAARLLSGTWFKQAAHRANSFRLTNSAKIDKLCQEPTLEWCTHDIDAHLLWSAERYHLEESVIPSACLIWSDYGFGRASFAFYLQ